MEQVMEYKKNYQQYKEELDAELSRTAEGFVRIGYLLKVARDTDILQESGYGSVVEFAQAEYNIDKTQVSRFIHINDKFSEGGYSEQLKEHYRSFGYAKLTLMLQLPDEINAELTPEYSKAEIQAVKEEVEAERAISDIEVMLEQQEAAGQDQTAGVQTAAGQTAAGPEIPEDSDLVKTVLRMLEDDPEMFADLWDFSRKELAAAPLQEYLAPDGQGIISTRIPGTGRKMLSLKDKDNGDEVVLIDVRSAEKQRFGWQELADVLGNILQSGETAADTWQHLYLSPFPGKKEEVAPVQHTESAGPAPKKEKKKDSKVKKAKTPEPKEPEKPEKTEWESPYQPGDKVVTIGGGLQGKLIRMTGDKGCWVFETEEGQRKICPEDDFRLVIENAGSGAQEGQQDQAEEQLPGQMNITDFKEYMPDEDKREDEGAEESAGGAEEQLSGVGGNGVQEPDAGDGAAEGGGREDDPGKMSEEENWFEINKRFHGINILLSVYGMKENAMDTERLKGLLNDTEEMAGAIKRILRLREAAAAEQLTGEGV